MKLKHGAAKTGSKWPEYIAWSEMKARCTNPNHPAFHNYGGRGISVCKRWMNSFEAFIADVGRRPSPDHSIDRYPDNDGDYKPGNFRWATSRQQRINTRTVRMLTLRGKTQCIIDWARETGINVYTIHSRLRRGWTIKRTLTT